MQLWMNETGLSQSNLHREACGTHNMIEKDKTWHFEIKLSKCLACTDMERLHIKQNKDTVIKHDQAYFHCLQNS